MAFKYLGEVPITGWSEMQNRRNHYRILHLQPDAPAEMVQMSYRTLMQRLRMHPDLGGDTWNAALINDAFATLSDPVRRAEYDRTIPSVQDQRRRPAAGTAPSPGTVNVPRCAFCDAPNSAHDLARSTAMCAICDSPLCPVVAETADDRTRRALTRLPQQLPIAFHLPWPQPRAFTGVSEDISITGMRFVTGLELVPGERLRIDCEFCTAVADVRHVHRLAGDVPLWQVGVAFVTLRVKRERGLFVSRRA